MRITVGTLCMGVVRVRAWLRAVNQYKSQMPDFERGKKGWWRMSMHFFTIAYTGDVRVSNENNES